MTIQKQFHVVLQGKGGVGKSVVARILAEYLHDRGHLIAAYDADGNNRSFAQAQTLGAIQVDLEDPENPDDVNTNAFDQIITDFLESNYSTVIDVGAGTYRPLVGYAERDGAFETVMEEAPVYLHVIVTGGQSMADTVENLDDVCERFQNSVKIIVWLNNYWGLVLDDHKRSFPEWAVAKRHWHIIDGIIEFPIMKKDTLLPNFRQMLTDNLTFREAIGDGKKGRYGVMQTSRLRKLKQRFWDQLDHCFALEATSDTPIHLVEAAETATKTRSRKRKTASAEETASSAGEPAS